MWCATVQYGGLMLLYNKYPGIIIGRLGRVNSMMAADSPARADLPARQEACKGL